MDGTLRKLRKELLEKKEKAEVKTNANVNEEAQKVIKWLLPIIKKDINKYATTPIVLYMRKNGYKIEIENNLADSYTINSSIPRIALFKEIKKIFVAAKYTVEYEEDGVQGYSEVRYMTICVD